MKEIISESLLINFERARAHTHTHAREQSNRRRFVNFQKQRNFLTHYERILFERSNMK